MKSSLSFVWLFLMLFFLFIVLHVVLFGRWKPYISLVYIHKDTILHLPNLKAFLSQCASQMWFWCPYKCYLGFNNNIINQIFQVMVDGNLARGIWRNLNSLWEESTKERSSFEKSTKLKIQANWKKKKLEFQVNCGNGGDTGKDRS